MRADVAARKDGGVFRLDRPNDDVGIFFAQRLPDAGERAARADARAETVDPSADLLHDLDRGRCAVDQRVVRVFKLLGDPNAVVLFCHADRGLQTLVNGFADVAVVVDEHQFCAVRFDELAPLLADRVGHDDAHAVALDRADERKTDALIAAGRLHDDRVGAEQTALFGFGHHAVRRAGLDRAADIDALVFD